MTFKVVHTNFTPAYTDLRPHEEVVYRETEADAQKELAQRRALVMSKVGGDENEVTITDLPSGRGFRYEYRRTREFGTYEYREA
jgi:hypothetical protein